MTGRYAVGAASGRVRGSARLLVAVSLLCAACSGPGDRAEPGPRPSAAESASAAAVERSVTGEPLRLPPPPEGGFDPAVTVTFEGAPPLRAEVARRPDQRARGLMQRRDLPEGAGMLFLFPGRSDGGFWMLGTLVPLSIAYVDGERVVAVREMTPCPGQRCPTYPPGAPYTAAVEARAGFFGRYGVGPGTRMTVTGRTAPPE